MGNDFWQLDGKTEFIRNRVCPPLVGGMAVWPVEGRIYLDAVENRCVALQVGADVGESMGVLTPDCPAGAADTYFRRLRSVWNIDVQHPTLYSDDMGWG